MWGYNDPWVRGEEGGEVEGCWHGQPTLGGSLSDVSPAILDREQGKCLVRHIHRAQTIQRQEMIRKRGKK